MSKLLCIVLTALIAVLPMVSVAQAAESRFPAAIAGAHDASALDVSLPFPGLPIPAGCRMEVRVIWKRGLFGVLYPVPEAVIICEGR